MEFGDKNESRTAAATYRCTVLRASKGVSEYTRCSKRYYLRHDVCDWIRDGVVAADVLGEKLLEKSRKLGRGEGANVCGEEAQCTCRVEGKRGTDGGKRGKTARIFTRPTTDERTERTTEQQ